MAAIPGGAGMPLIGDKSIEFYRDAITFVNKRIDQHKSRVFISRLLNKPTVFVASNSGVRELLNEHSDCLELGYKSFMHHIYGDNVLFSDGADGTALRDSLHSLLSGQESLEYFKNIIDTHTKKHLGKINCGSPVAVYETFKRLATEICLSLFLGINFEASTDLAAKVVALTTTHWHGIISVPVSLNMPGLSRSTYSKALEAKDKLLDIIRDKLQENSEFFAQKLKATTFVDPLHAANHLLLFTSALVPKAIASLLMSFILVTSQQRELQTKLLSDPELLQCTMLEIQRMWPPLVGGRRIAKQGFLLEGKKVPDGAAVVYLTHHAHRDPDVFDDPDSFQPTRWQHKNCHDREKSLFVFGSGPRDCVGQHIVTYILQTVSTSLLEQYTWEPSGQDNSLTYKWLPVARPRNSVKVIFQPKGQSQGHAPDARSPSEDETIP